MRRTRGSDRGRSRDEEEEEYSATSDEAADDEEEVRHPVRRRRASSRREEAEEEERPRRRSSRRDEADEEDNPPRRRRSRVDDEEGKSNRKRKVASGWGGYKQTREERSDYVKFYKLPTRPTLIKILDSEPFAVYSEHWLDDLPKNTKKSYLCIGDDCPLCAIGEKARVYSVFNIVDLNDPENPVVTPWRTSQTVTDLLESYADDDKTSPLNREDLYWSIHKSGDKNRSQTNLSVVKKRDLMEDWDFQAFSRDELEEFEDVLLTEDNVLYWNTKAELRDIADDL